MISNFARQGLEEHGGGHFSPLGAYNEANDAVLVMDVARYKVWVEIYTPDRELRDETGSENVLRLKELGKCIETK